MHKTNSCLNDICLQYVDRKLFVNPIGGWGWSLIEKYDPPNISEGKGINVPEPFNVIVKNFYYYLGELRGAIFLIDEPNHVYDNYWSVVYTRNQGNFDFKENIGDYNILIGSNEPYLMKTSEFKEWSEIWPEWNFSKLPFICGYAKIGETKLIIEEYYQKLIDEWNKNKKIK